MRRPKLYALLDRAGLGHLADQPMNVTRAGGALHGIYRCPQAGSWTGPEAVLSEELTTTPRQVHERVCPCLEYARWAPYGAISEAEEVVTTYARPRRRPVPTGGGFSDLVALADRVNGLERAAADLSWCSGSDPAVLAVRDRLKGELKDEVDVHVERLRRLGAGAVLRHEAALAAASLPDARLEREVLDSLVGKRGTHLVLRSWFTQVDSGTSREVRRRSLAALLGTFLLHEVEEEGDRTLLRERVLLGLGAVSGIEDRLQRTLDFPPPSVLVPFEHQGSVGASGRLLLEAFTVAEHGDHRLLAIPEPLLPRLDPSGARVESLFPVVPDDPSLLETAAGLWDPSGESVFSDPRTLLQAAALV